MLSVLRQISRRGLSGPKGHPILSRQYTLIHRPQTHHLPTADVTLYVKVRNYQRIILQYFHSRSKDSFFFTSVRSLTQIFLS